MSYKLHISTTIFAAFLVEARAYFQDIGRLGGPIPTSVESHFGTHGVEYGADESGIYARIGMTLPEGVWAEVDDGTYGTMQAFRIYLANTDGFPKPAESRDGKHEFEVGVAGIDVYEAGDGSIIHTIQPEDDDFDDMLRLIVRANL